MKIHAQQKQNLLHGENLGDAFAYTKLSEEAKNEFIRSVKFQLESIAENHLYRGSCSLKKELNCCCHS